MLYYIINNSFEMSDTDIQIDTHNNGNNTFDYVPVIEVNMTVSNMNIAIVKMMANITIILAYIMIKYQIYLIKAPSLYKMEQEQLQVSSFSHVLAFLLAAITTQYI
jgi:hypothetical protein